MAAGRDNVCGLHLRPVHPSSSTSGSFSICIAASAEWHGTTRRMRCQQKSSGGVLSLIGHADTLSALQCVVDYLQDAMKCALHTPFLYIRRFLERMLSKQQLHRQTGAREALKKLHLVQDRISFCRGMHHVQKVSTWYRMTPMLQQSDRCLSTSFLLRSTSGAAGAW